MGSPLAKVRIGTERPAVDDLNRLAEQAALWLQRDACLAIRFPYIGCDRCVRICPVEVLSQNGNGPELVGDCLNCGRCVAACPTDALGMPRAWLESPEETGTVLLDCQRVPATLADENTLRPPCLGAIRVSELLRLQRSGPATLLDRGWCKDCPAGGERHPAADAVSEANELLGRSDPDAEPTIRIESSPLPEKIALAAIPDPLIQRRTGRRSFLRQLAGEATAMHVEPAPPPAPAPIDIRRRIEPVERLARIAALPSETPTALLSALTPSDNCCDHQVCTRLCPTGALQSYRDGDSGGIRFDSRRCIACKACVEGCPERALRIEPGGGSTSVVTLTRHRRQRCFTCSRSFTVTEPTDDTPPVCPTCLKSRRLMQSGFAALFNGER